MSDGVSREYDALAAVPLPSAQRHRLLSGILSSIRDFTYAFDRDGRVLFANQPLLDRWGVAAEEAAGRNFHELGYPPELAARLQQQIHGVFDTGKTVTDETPYTSPAGVTGVYEYIFSPSLGADGRIAFVVGSTRDITERKQAEGSTRRLAQRLANALESIPDGFFTVDREWRFTYVNQEAERVLRGERETLIGQTLWEVLPRLLGTEFERSCRRAMGGEKGISFEALHAPRAAWFEVNCHGSEDGLSVQFRDITATRAERRQLELLQASVSQINDHVVITEIVPGQSEPRIVFVNDALVRSSRYGRDELLGRSPLLLPSPWGESFRI